MASDTELFYRKLSAIYDQLFPVESDTLALLEQAGAAPGRPVLDLACGSGLYTEALLRKGVDIYGLDLSPDLLDKARARSAEPDRFVTADMRFIGPDSTELKDHHLPAAFDLVYCIGNSLSHLESAADVRLVLQAVADRLPGPESVAVIQYVDMEEIAIGSERNLPTLTFGGTSFERRYLRRSSDRVTFDAALVDGGTRDAIENDLLVLRTADLIEWFGGFGFESVDVWGGFDFRPVSDSWVRVLRASREAHTSGVPGSDLSSQSQRGGDGPSSPSQ